MRVHIVCEQCEATTEIHVIGGWDIETVVHHCRRDPLGEAYFRGRELKPGEFGITYDPPRRAF